MSLVLLSLVLTFLMDNTVKISISGLIYNQVLYMSLVLLSLVSPSLWITPVKIVYQVLYMSLVLLSLVLLSLGVTFLMDNTSGDQYIRSYMYVTGVTVTGVTSLWITPVKISISGLIYVTGVTVSGVTVTGVTFLVDNTSEDQYIRSYIYLWCYCHWCYCHWCHLPYG